MTNTKVICRGSFRYLLFFAASFTRRIKTSGEIVVMPSIPQVIVLSITAGSSTVHTHAVRLFNTKQRDRYSRQEYLPRNVTTSYAEPPMATC